jgi:LL-diaminopimelate aminotransferase
MAGINKNFDRLASGYLFPEVARRSRAWSEAHPGKKLVSLGIGNTTEALAPSIVEAMKHKLDLLSNRETYTGYGDEQGDTPLREALAAYYGKRGVKLDAKEFFVSDGAKSDAANLQELFSPDCIIAVQNPAYPVYVDSNVVGGRTGLYNAEIGGYDGFVYLECNAENGFIAKVPSSHVDVIYLCSPNNPTGAVMSKAQLAEFVDYARREKALIVFDAAYSEYIEDETLPRSIYEVEGAEECAIEINSFSKSAGFTGVRLGWTVVPFACVLGDSEKGKLNAMWNRRQCTFFNGASNISQAGGLAYFTETGYKECMDLVNYYKGNAKLIREAMTECGFKCFGGDNSPYIWMETANGMSSWDFFDLLVDKCQVIVTPGSGFGYAGEGYVRISSYGHRENVITALARIKEYFHG